MQASSAPLQPSVRWSFQVFSNLSLEPIQTCHHDQDTSPKIEGQGGMECMKRFSSESRFLFCISIPNLSVPGWLLSRRLWISEKFEVILLDLSWRLSTPSWRLKKTSWWFGRNRFEIPRALKMVLVNPTDSKLVKYFTATWQYHSTQNFETFWDFMNGFGRKTTENNRVLHTIFGHVFFNDFQISFLLCQQTWGLSPWNLKWPVLNQPESRTRGSFRIPSWIVGIPYKPSLRKRVLLGKGVTTTQHWTLNLLVFIWKCI